MTAQGGDSKRDPAVLVEIGQQLTARREELGRSIADAERELKIRKVYLGALESGSTRFPLGLVYRLGFLRAYADYLGLDGRKLVSAYRRALEPPQTSRAPQRAVQGEGKGPEPAGEPAEPLPALAERMAVAARGRSSVRGRSRAAAWIVVALLLGLALVTTYLLGVWPFTDGLLGPGSGGEPPPVSGPEDPEPPPPEEGEEPPPGGTEFTADQVRVLAESSGELRLEVDAEELQVRLLFTGRVWIRAAADGLTVYEGFVEPGSASEFQALDLLELRLGRARETVVYVFDVEVGPAGPVDDVRTVVIVRKP